MSRLRKSLIFVHRLDQHERETEAYLMTAPFVLRPSNNERMDAAAYEEWVAMVTL
ncbi:MAG: hypothetical protein Nkreftii_002524 [Candidatus Nitrospira kreftii]|uniref:Uncharacterized protein n=1 Tax=Candidatus Nitrospira kreftii TaxID=2652173 RepID=A0A7S8FF85_9BACT|nr:MAG: hypothetical protein Nkreftii_002524 [Candidatus Nitrospira kreftii]